MGRRHVFAALAGLTLVVSGVSPASAFPGELDATFGADGRREIAFGASLSAETVALMADGRLVTAGWTQNRRYVAGFSVVRLLADGRLDDRFGGGVVRIGFAGEAWATDVVVQASGKAVAAGYRYAPGPEPGLGTEKVALARLTADGSLDETFGGDGKVLTSVGDGATAAAIVRQPDGRYVVAGSAIDRLGRERSLLLRYRADGALDGSFGRRGKVLGPVGSHSHDVDLVGDGRVVVAGASGDELMVARYLSNGELDRSFGGDGVVTIASRLTGGGVGQMYANDVLALPNGKLVVAGGEEGYRAECDAVGFPVVTRLLASGAVDDRFGVRRINPRAPDRCPNEEFQAVDRRIGRGFVAVGYVPWLVVGLHPGGALDRGFGSEGIVRDATDAWGAFDVAVNAAGRITVVGVYSDSTTRAAVMRYLDA